MTEYGTPRWAARCKCGVLTEWERDEETGEMFQKYCGPCSQVLLEKAKAMNLPDAGRLTEAQSQKFLDLVVAQSPLILQSKPVHWWNVWGWLRYLFRKRRDKVKVVKFKMDKLGGGKC